MGSQSIALCWSLAGSPRFGSTSLAVDRTGHVLGRLRNGLVFARGIILTRQPGRGAARVVGREDRTPHTAGLVPRFIASPRLHIRTVAIEAPDRLAHSALGQDSFAEHADDLDRLIEQLDLAPVHAVGNSGRSAFARRLAAKRLELSRSKCRRLC